MMKEEMGSLGSEAPRQRTEKFSEIDFSMALEFAGEAGKAGFEESDQGLHAILGVVRDDEVVESDDDEEDSEDREDDLRAFAESDIVPLLEAMVRRGLLAQEGERYVITATGRAVLASQK